MAEARCECCGLDTSGWTVIDRLHHLNNCLDDHLKPLIDDMNELNGFTQRQGTSPVPTTDAAPSNSDNLDLTGMPNYAEMPKLKLQSELDNFGIKKTLDVAEGRVLLQEIWVYQKYGIWPKSLQEYL